RIRRSSTAPSHVLSTKLSRSASRRQAHVTEDAPACSRARRETGGRVSSYVSSGQLGFLLVDDEGRLALRDHLFVDHDLLDAGARGHVVHDVEERALEDGAEAAGAGVARE